MPKKYVHTKRGKCLNYDQIALEMAISDVRADRLSIRKASEKYSVPKSTIGDRISGKHALGTSHGRPPALPKEMEDTIASSAKMASKLGVGLSPRQIMQRTRVMCQKTKIAPTYGNFKAGKGWYQGLMKRHPDLALRKP